MKASIKEREEYSRWLKKMQRKLGFKNGELAEYAGVSLATAGKYLTGDSYPSSQHIKDRINEFIENFSVIEGFHRLENQEFYSKLSELVRAFKVSQDEIAEATGVPQSYISDYLSKNPKRRLTTATQYKILKFFLEKTYITGWKINPEYEKQGILISDLLNLPYKVYAYRGNRQKEEIQRILTNFSNLPLKIKRAIRENHMTFFWLDGAATSDASDNETLVRNFNSLNPDLRQQLLKKLSSVNVDLLSPAQSYFDIVCSFFRLMSVSNEFPVLLKDKSIKKRTAEDKELDKWFKRMIYIRANLWTVSWESIERKLTINSEGWYFLMLLYVYNTKDFILKELDAAIKKAIK